MSESGNRKTKTNTSIATGMSLAMLSTTCCALPIVLVTLGMGGAVGSMMSNFPILMTISKYKIYTFSFTGIVLGYCWFQLYQLNQGMVQEGANCDIQSQKMLKWQKRFLWIATIMLGISIFAAYALLPIQIFIDNLGE